MKSTVFWVVNRSKLAQLSFPPPSAGPLLGLLFDPEDEIDMFLRNRAVCELHNVIAQMIEIFINETHNLLINTSWPRHFHSVLIIVSETPIVKTKLIGTYTSAQYLRN
jgi:hypothetical protein